MNVSPAGRHFIGLHEGLRLAAYRDAVGVWTIGYGHTAMAGPPAPAAGMTITREEADAILARDLKRFEDGVSRLVAVPLAQHEFDALVSFAFNVGEGNLSRSTLLRKLNAGDRAGAAAEFGKWNKAGGRVLPGLTRRRAEERAMFAERAYAGVPASVSRLGSGHVPEYPDADLPSIDDDARTIARLNLRDGAGTGAKILATLPDNHPVDILETWHRVRTLHDGDAIEGWVSGAYLSGQS